MKYTMFSLVALAISIAIAVAAYSYSQDPRTCTDPRTQFPSNPPCQHEPRNK